MTSSSPKVSTSWYTSSRSYSGLRTTDSITIPTGISTAAATTAARSVSATNSASSAAPVGSDSAPAR